MGKQVILGVCPSKSNCYRIITLKGKGKVGHSSLCKTDSLLVYEAKFYIQCHLYRNRGISGYFELHLDVYYPSERADLDNSLKIVLDCLQGCKAIKNDNKCVHIVARKFLDKERPRIEFELVEVN